MSREALGHNGAPATELTATYRPPVGACLESLLNAARRGSPAALGELLERCRRYLLLIANRSLDSDLRPKAAASDLVQDTFIEAHRDFAHFQGSTEQELLAWLTRILEHRLSNNVRRYRRTLKRGAHREQSLDADDAPAPRSLLDRASAPMQAMIARDDEARLLAALDRLPASLREVLMLRTWERRTFVEIAEQLRASPDAVRKTWGRAVRRLQAELQDKP